MSPPREWMCGQQRLWMEASDLLCMELHGTFDVAAVEAYLRLVFDLADRHGTFSLLADMRDLRGIAPQARSRLSRVDRPYPYRAVALHGASFTFAIMAMMVVKAGRTLAPAAFPFELAFFQTEAQARTYLAPFLHPPQGRG
ncbi:STAS/SEC14 domain-containing protein [Polyangium sp. y55x31]|uniref:STAS/SEC14 domain-containing protein n=1 Tax=Polyangium sp. y55x31 TaxID=3042688 RepID=UPI002482E212|nr:STAS/SEC14 domain-containing protein [Polyangium sp. y55x31]MDI1476675.1 STAS/SEC14 domain-containing protein [Polyangium sp. y55x31]